MFLLAGREDASVSLNIMGSEGGARPLGLQMGRAL